MNQNLSICQHYTWIHWPAAQQACPEGSRATPGRSSVSFPPCLAVPARLVEPFSPNIAAISDQSRAETAEAQLPPLMCCLSRSTHSPVATRNYSVLFLFVCLFWGIFFFFLPRNFHPNLAALARWKSFQVVSKCSVSVWWSCCGARQCITVAAHTQHSSSKKKKKTKTKKKTTEFKIINA